MHRPGAKRPVTRHRPVRLVRAMSNGLCKQSPTGAHHWLLGRLGSLDNCNEGRCRHCGATRLFEPTFHTPMGVVGQGGLSGKFLEPGPDEKGLE